MDSLLSDMIKALLLPYDAECVRYIISQSLFLFAKKVNKLLQ